MKRVLLLIACALVACNEGQEETPTTFKIINNITLMPGGFYSPTLERTVTSLDGSLWNIRPQFFMGEQLEHDSWMKQKYRIEGLSPYESSVPQAIDSKYTSAEFSFRLISGELQNSGFDLCIATHNYVILQPLIMNKGAENILTVTDQTIVARRYHSTMIGPTMTIQELLQKYKDELSGTRVSFCESM